MGKVLSFVNYKGGVGKTTSVVNLASALNKAQKRTLVIDLDPQGSASKSFKIPSDEEVGVYELLFENKEFMQVVQQVRPFVYLLAGTNKLRRSASKLQMQSRREDVLRDAIKDYIHHFDYILIDCPPSLQVYIDNAYSASDGVVIPMSVDFLAEVGVSQAILDIESEGKNINKDLYIVGVLLTRFRKTTNESALVENNTRTALANYYHVFEAVIPESVKAMEAPRNQSSVIELDHRNAVSLAYINFAGELVKHVQ